MSHIAVEMIVIRMRVVVNMGTVVVAVILVAADRAHGKVQVGVEAGAGVRAEARAGVLVEARVGAKVGAHLEAGAGARVEARVGAQAGVRVGARVGVGVEAAARVGVVATVVASRAQVLKVNRQQRVWTVQENVKFLNSSIASF